MCVVTCIAATSMCHAHMAASETGAIVAPGKAAVGEFSADRVLLTNCQCNTSQFLGSLAGVAKVTLASTGAHQAPLAKEQAPVGPMQ